MHTLSVKLTDEEHALLEAKTNKKKANKSQIVREALRLYLETPRSTDEMSFLQQAKDLCGIVNGVSDLSTNPKHMKGYGE